jgi:RHS repeat-associated protein
VINNALTVLEHRHYEPYGALYAGTMAETPFGFTGEWRDGGTGMYYLRARYYNPAHGVFVSQDVLETLNRYAYVGGNPVNRVDPSGMIFWSFPTGGNRNTILQAEPYLPRITALCPSPNAHAWIERWLEVNNATHPQFGYLATQLEFPGGGQQRRIDAIVFDNLNLQVSPPLHRGGSLGHVFEIAPINPLSRLGANEYTELLTKLGGIQSGSSPFLRSGAYPSVDFWLNNPGNSNPGAAQLATFVGTTGATYDWSGVSFVAGTRLSPSIAAGAVKVDQNQLGNTTVIPADAALWIMVIAPGLLVYTNECEVKTAERVLDVSSAIAGAFLLRRYLEALSRWLNGRPGYGPLPRPQPTFAYEFPIDPLWAVPTDPIVPDFSCLPNDLWLNPSDIPVLPNFDLLGEFNY